MSKPKYDPRAQVALDMTGNLFLNTTTKFTPISKLPLMNAVDERLNQRVQAAIKSKSPDNKNLQTIKLSQLGKSGLWKGMDSAPQRKSKSPGNQQRLITSKNQSSLSPQQRRNLNNNINVKNSKETEIKIQQNSQKKNIQRTHNRNAQNEVNTSRYKGQTEVKGNIVTQNLLRNQRSVKDDFQIGDKSADKKRKMSTSNQKGENKQLDRKQRVVTESRAMLDYKEKRVNFSPEKPKLQAVQKKQVVVPTKPYYQPPSKNTKPKEEPYVYVPPKKKEDSKSYQQENYSSVSLSRNQKTPVVSIQNKTLPYKSLSPKKEEKNQLIHVENKNTPFKVQPANKSQKDENLFNLSSKAQNKPVPYRSQPIQLQQKSSPNQNPFTITPKKQLQKSNAIIPALSTQVESKALAINTITPKKEERQIYTLNSGNASLAKKDEKVIDVNKSQTQVSKTLPYRSVTPKKEEKVVEIKPSFGRAVSPVKPQTASVTLIQKKFKPSLVQTVHVSSPVKTQSPTKPAAINYSYQTTQKNNNSTYVYVPPQKKQAEQSQNQSLNKIQSLTNISPKKVQFVFPKPQTALNAGNSSQKQVLKPIIRPTQAADNRIVSPTKSIQKFASQSQKLVSRQLPYQSAKPQQIQENKKAGKPVKFEQKSIVVAKQVSRSNNNINISLNSSVSKVISPKKNETSLSSSITRKNNLVSNEELNKDWSKIKQTLKYDKSLSPSKSPSKKVPERQDIAMKMLAQVFLNASTRYSPGLSFLLKRGISKEEIDAIRSKSQEFKINIVSTQRKSPTKIQPKTDRKLNWVENAEKNKSKQNNRAYQGDVTATQYKVKKQQQPTLNKEQQKQVGTQSFKKNEDQKPKHANIVSQSLQKSNRKVTRDDFLLNKPPHSASQESKSIRESPDVYKRQVSKKDVQDSKKQVQKLKEQIQTPKKNVIYSPSKSKVAPQLLQSYVYQPPAPKIDSCKVISVNVSSIKIIETKEESKQSIGSSKPTVKPQTQQHLNTSKSIVQATKPEPIKPITVVTKPMRPETETIKQLNTSKSSTVLIQPSQSRINNQKPQSIVPSTSQKSIVIEKEKPTNLNRQTVNNASSFPNKAQNNVPKPEEKKSVINYGQNANKTGEVQKKPTLQEKNVSVMTTKSQTSIWNQPDIKKGIEKHAAITTPKSNKNTANQSGYVYQPPSTKREEQDNSNIQQNYKSVKSVQSQKVISKLPIVTPIKQIQPIMQKKDHKTIEVVVKQQKSTSSIVIKQASPLSKKFCIVVSLVLKKRLNTNLHFAMQKLQQNSKIKAQHLKQVSLLLRVMVNFSQNFQKILKRQAFKNIKKGVITSMNKIKQIKPIEGNNQFALNNKESTAKIIYQILKYKLQRAFNKIKAKYHQSKNKHSNGAQIALLLDRIVQKRLLINKKDGFKKIKAYKTHKSIALQKLFSILGKTYHHALADNFSFLIKRDSKQLNSIFQQYKKGARPSIKGATNDISRPILTASKSQETLPLNKKQQSTKQQFSFNQAELAKIQSKRKQFEKSEKDLQRKKQNLQQEVNDLNKNKRAFTKKNVQLKFKLKELLDEIGSEEIIVSQIKGKSKEAALSEQDLVPILTRIYAYLFQDQSQQTSIERFLSDNQHSFQLPTNPALLNQWKGLMKNTQLKKLIKRYQGEQPRERKINEIVNQENELIGRLLRSFIRERYVWQWVNIIANQ